MTRGLRHGRTNFPQRGGVTLVISITLLIAVTLIVFVMARTSLMEQRIAANDYRGQQAFEAAEAGLEYAIGRMNAASRATLDSVTTFAEAGFNCDPADARLDEVCAGDPNDHGGAIFEMSLDDLDLDTDYANVEITSTGYSDDNSAVRDIFVQTAWVPVLGNPPPYPLVARNEVTLSGSAFISSPLPEPQRRCIWSGGSADAEYPAHTDCSGLDDDKGKLGESADEFFENFFLMTRDHLRTQFTAEAVEGQTLLLTPDTVGGTNYWTALVDSYDSTAVRAFWIDGGNEDVVIDGSAGDLGTGDVPVLIIIEKFADLIIGGDVTINGLIYVAGDWNNESNSAAINGGVIVEGNVELGGIEIAYAPADNAPGRYAKIPGSWRDFVDEP